VKESSTVESLTWVNEGTGAVTMGSAVIGDTGRACSWTCEVAEVGAEIGALTGALDDWGVVGVAGGAHGLSETMELAENLTLGEVGVDTGACCIVAGACWETAFLAHSSIRVRGAGGLACLKSPDANGRVSIWVRTSIMSLISSML